MVQAAYHRLDRADRGGGNRQAVDAQADQRHRLHRPPAHLAAHPQVDARFAAWPDDARQEAQDRWAQPVIAFGEPRVGAIGGKQELRQVVGADRQEVEIGQQQVELLGERGHFQHRAIADAAP
ncbi:hypothetical protein WR25_01598 [Diploscapter pachys]|uniref:Uncharacterized protein n=1 Tax=Diploscapter pachys TaxID=2018661 RepID=A0A2A2M3L0_9BILA|nr:hypothetical protein WR25_01598 [Diploscapter pachys]